MKITIFGATGGVGSECLKQAVEARHDITILIRNADKLPSNIRERINAIEGDALNASDVASALENDPDAVLFAIGYDKNSPDYICTKVTRHILEHGVKRFIWCGGGATKMPDDIVNFGFRFTDFLGRLLSKNRVIDKEHQAELLHQHLDTVWLGLRPIAIKDGPRTETYHLGFGSINPISTINFADVAHAMLNMITDDTWLHKAPHIHY